MTAIVSRERATATWLTGVIGLVILAAAFVMMACAAPSLASPRPHGAMTQSAGVYTSSLITGVNRASHTGQTTGNSGWSIAAPAGSSSARPSKGGEVRQVRGACRASSARYRSDKIRRRPE